MTEQELEQLLEEFQKNPMGRWAQIGGAYTTVPWPIDTLVAEVRRLRGLVEELGRQVGYCCGDAPACNMSYCHFCNHEPGKDHKPDCTVFTPEGKVK